MPQFRLSWAAIAALAICTITVQPARVIGQSTQARPGNAAALLERVQRTYRLAKSFRLSFQQTVTNPLTGTTSMARGELVSQQPNLFAITFSEPATDDKIVCDGTSVWLYLPSSVPGQVVKMPANGNGGVIADPLGHILTAPKGHYVVADGGRDTVAGRSARAVTLTPSTPDPLFTKATVWIDEESGAVRRVDTNEASGVTRQVVITKQAINVSVPRATFTFTPPAKVRVVDQSVLGG